MLSNENTCTVDNRVTIGDEESGGQRHNLSSVKRVFRALPDAILCFSQDTKILMLNPAMEKILGYREEELVGKLTIVLFSDREEYLNLVRQRAKLSAEESLKPIIVKFRTKNGSVISAEMTSSVVKGRYGEEDFYLNLMRDVTEQKKLEKRLRQLEHTYRTVADFAYDWECWRLPDGSFKYVSPSCERITGYTAPQFISYPQLFREIIVPEDRDVWDRYLENAQKNIRQEELQFRILRKDGSIRWIEHVCQPVIGKNNELQGYRSSNRDITRRKLNENELRQALFKIKEYQKQLQAESIYLREEMKLSMTHDDIVGDSNAMQYVFLKIDQIASTHTSVLLLGETGTGKSLFARAIHNTSPRKDKPLIKINCATLPVNLIESELFGHEKGSFTSAHERQIGRFEMADKATIFLDEIGELPLELQAKLLRFLQEGEFERLGGAQTIKVDVRVIAATNRNLEEDVENGLFRQDLYYRLNVFPITAPPLRDRGKDISQLVKYFTEKFSKKQRKTISSIPYAVMKNLEKYHWPGNVRELENVIERAVITTTGSELNLVDDLRPKGGVSEQNITTLEVMEREHILKALEATNWKVSGKNSAAEILGLKRSTLRAKIDKHRISKV